MTHINKKYFIAFFSLIVFGMTNLYAADLSTAKSQGLIGEQANGYLGAVSKVNADIKKLIKQVNKKRKARYLEIAKKQKITLAKVEKIAGKKAMEKTVSGNYIQKSGKWVKKPN